jgi:asparagine synthase (glutamine-hydrolysing)
MLQRMNDAQSHRGPHVATLHLEPGLGLGHRRLAITDIATGPQPSFNEDGSAVVVSDGDLYNRHELIAELQALGHVFISRSEAECIAHGWAAWGEDCVTHFRGTVAFALWDRPRRTFFLARDRLGAKPLHYALLEDGTLLFGSELKSLLAYQDGRVGLDRTLDPRAVEEYFALGYVAEPRTIFRQARKLQAAHTLTIRRGEPLPAAQEYWNLRFTVDNPIKTEDACAELNSRLRESVRLCMVAEVPLGALLSGGVNSSAVVATMAALSTAPVNTCAIGFDDPAINESGFAQTVAERHHTSHRLEVAGTDDFDLIDLLARLYDEPFADSSAIPTYRACQLASRQMTVALSGDGGDESFGGYPRYRRHLMQERARSAAQAPLRPSIFDRLGRALRSRTSFEAGARTPVQAYLGSVSILSGPMRAQLFSPRFKQQMAGYSALEVFEYHAARADTEDSLALIQYLDLKTHLVGCTNTKVDRAAMAHSLLVREPLMDHALVEWLGTLPTSLKVRGQEGKYLLRKAMQPLLPADVLYRPKVEFSVPLARWFRGPLRERVRQAVLGPRLAATGWFDRQTLEHLVNAHQSGARDHGAALWSLLMFEAFLRVVVDGSANGHLATTSALEAAAA